MGQKREKEEKKREQCITFSAFDGREEGHTATQIPHGLHPAFHQTIGVGVKTGEECLFRAEQTAATVLGQALYLIDSIH